ncbi:hypothetical protein CRI94_15470 [Longibacter salinarum]|uniref:DUF3825 domain-containing protein n=1 Tax=Longibacter salinarum TaxID=1850348 RepID=A0A2A8CUK0_9BACT|nr:DUF3825 domain-containing protein [Longibacter salinarum]PEN11433.1 hypothetical protein CRI94_15470 [Longibacter salinarum]
MSNTWPNDIHQLIFIPNVEGAFNDLAELAEDEVWHYVNEERQEDSEKSMPVLYNYVKYTYRRLAEEDKVVVADNGGSIVFNTGLVTESQEPIFCYSDQNRMQDVDVPWHFQGWIRKGDWKLNGFSTLPPMAHYYDDPASLVLDTRKEIRVNVEHIIRDNRDRFPEPYDSMSTFQLQTFLKGTIDNAIERAKRNYKAAVPQYHQGRIQILLPLCLSNPNAADLALVVEDKGAFYRASTCLPLDWAYNNARQLARPDRDWLKP